MFDEEVVFDKSELEYIKKAACGDHDAFGKLVLAYETPVLTYLQSILGNRENARDLAQETFIRAFYALPHWQPASLKDKQTAHFNLDHPLAPWLYRIATNQALTFLKKQGRYKHADVLEDHRYRSNKRHHGKVSKHC